jgi:hypothetical protein
MGPILSHLNPVHNFLTLISILSFHLLLGLSSAFFPLCFLTKILHAFFISPIRDTCPAYLIFFDLTTKNIWLKVKNYEVIFCVFLLLPLLRSKYSPQNLVLKHPQSVFFRQKSPWNSNLIRFHFVSTVQRPVNLFRGFKLSLIRRAIIVSGCSKGYECILLDITARR